jgi:hypothetical protein
MNSVLAWAFAAVLLLGGQGLAAEATGTALAVDIDARAELAGTTRVLTAGDDLAIGETVVTDGRGLVQIKFSDDTELVVGPNSRLLLEDYLLRGDGSVGKLAINALSGSFRFVTGNSNKDDYSIRTPTGTIGIRGTAFDFFVETVKTRMLMYHGSSTLCGAGNACVTMQQTCEAGEAEATKAQSLGLSFTADDAKRTSLQQSFHYADFQKPLQYGFRVDQVPICQLIGPARFAPTSIDDVMALCTPVIAEQYEGVVDRWGYCSAAVAGYLASLSDPADEQIADLTAKLVELFQPGTGCKIHETELPEALAVAALKSKDAVQQAAIREIGATIRDCVEGQTRSVARVFASPS